MTWVVPKDYSRNQTDKAGEILISDTHTNEEMKSALDILENQKHTKVCYDR